MVALLVNALARSATMYLRVREDVASMGAWMTTVESDRARKIATAIGSILEVAYRGHLGESIGMMLTLKSQMSANSIVLEERAQDGGPQLVFGGQELARAHYVQSQSCAAQCDADAVTCVKETNCAFGIVAHQ